MRKLLVVILSLAIASVASAAGGRAEQMREPDRRVMKMSVHLGGFGQDSWLEVVELFEAANPGVTVEIEISPTNFEQLRLQYLSGRDLPDFHFAPTWALDYQALMDEGLLYSLEEVLRKPSPYGQGTLEDLILPSVLANMRQADGNLYLMPFSLGSNGLWYDETLFLERGWAVPRTFEEFLAFGQTARAAGIAPFTFPAANDYLGFILYPTIASIAGSSEPIERINNLEPGAFKQPAVIEMLRRVEILRDRNMIQRGALGFNNIEAQTEFALRRAATVVSGDWVWAEMRHVWPDDFELRFMGNPLVRAGETRFSWMHLIHAAVPKNASNPDLGAEFARFMFTEEAMRVWARNLGVVRPIRGVENFTDYLFDAKRDAIGYLTDSDNNPIYVAFPYAHRELGTMFKDKFNELIEGISTIDQITDAMEAAARRVRENR